MLLDTRTQNSKQSQVGFSPNVVNDEREPSISSGSKFGYIFL
jgi:hypothetical protein